MSEEQAAATSFDIRGRVVDTNFNDLRPDFDNVIPCWDTPETVIRVRDDAGAVWTIGFAWRMYGWDSTPWPMVNTDEPVSAIVRTDGAVRWEHPRHGKRVALWEQPVRIEGVSRPVRRVLRLVERFAVLLERCGKAARSAEANGMSLKEAYEDTDDRLARALGAYRAERDAREAGPDREAGL